VAQLARRTLCPEANVRQTGVLNTRAGFGLLPSFPMEKLALLRFPIDHCLISPELIIVNCRLAVAATRAGIPRCS
jgi:hypothetical protein